MISLGRVVSEYWNKLKSDGAVTRINIQELFAKVKDNDRREQARKEREDLHDARRD